MARLTAPRHRARRSPEARSTASAELPAGSTGRLAAPTRKPPSLRTNPPVRRPWDDRPVTGIAAAPRAELGPSIRRFLEAPRFATLATINRDGTPHQTVVWYLLEDDGSLLINSLVGRRWPANLRRDPRMSLVVEDGLDYVAIRGEAEEVDDGDLAREHIFAMARRYESPDEAERLIEHRFRPQHRVSFRIHPRTLDAHGDLGS